MTDHPDGAPADRIGSLDLIRGVAVLGILAINIGGFAGPGVETVSPNYMARVSSADEWTFAAMFLLFEGKMRTLFTMLFGASMVLFIERSEAIGRPGMALQVRRLLWLGVFGYLHFLLLWWGDILFFYALAGMLALPFRNLRPALLATIGIGIFTLWNVQGIVQLVPYVAAEERILQGAASQTEIAADNERTEQFREFAAREGAGVRAGFADHVRLQLADDPLAPVQAAIDWLGETLPLILIGMALYRSGFFSGGWGPAALRRIAGAAARSTAQPDFDDIAPARVKRIIDIAPCPAPVEQQGLIAFLLRITGPAVFALPLQPQPGFDPPRRAATRHAEQLA